MTAADLIERTLAGMNDSYAAGQRAARAELRRRLRDACDPGLSVVDQTCAYIDAMQAWLDGEALHDARAAIAHATRAVPT